VKGSFDPSQVLRKAAGIAQAAAVDAQKLEGIFVSPFDGRPIPRRLPDGA